MDIKAVMFMKDIGVGAIKYKQVIVTSKEALWKQRHTTETCLSLFYQTMQKRIWTQKSSIGQELIFEKYIKLEEVEKPDPYTGVSRGKAGNYQADTEK